VVEVQAFLDTRHVHYEECHGVNPLQSELDALKATMRALPSGSSMMRTDFVNGKWRVWDDLGEATLLGEFKNSDHAQAYRAMVKHRATLDATTPASERRER
jgi:hypothetical protein